MTAPGHGRGTRGAHAFTPTRRRLLIGGGAAALGLASVPAMNAAFGAAAEPGSVDPATAVAATQEIKQLKARYFRAIDTKNWALLRQQLTDDVVVDTTGSFGPRMTGADEFIGFIRLTIGAAETVHQGHMPEIDVTSPTTATGIWALQDLLIWLGTVKVNGFGHYHETYSLVDGRWLISSSKLTRVYLDPLAQVNLLGLKAEIRL
ncbi:nuclear transport factor 2 family protein [Streptomyces sp. NPDC050619]|uniref:nuclear transport factor 2 family protein n=1 Tax=Streptomyces sp. NPDC050619 TaxID=3157214 RepID=UPI003412E443